MPKSAFITGISGQDGSYLAEFLLEKGYDVYGLKRRTSTVSTERIEHILDKITIIDGDMTDTASLDEAIRIANPDEIYNLAAQSNVKSSFAEAEYTGNSTGLGVLRLLELIRKRQDNTGKQIRFYQASTSELFGSTPPPQNEKSLFHPRSPYAIAKLYAYWSVVNYREAYNIFGCNGILMNHESKRRGIDFVTQKIATGVANIKAGNQKSLGLGNLEAKRDWGHAYDFVIGMWLMLQHDVPDDYVLATGVNHTVKEFCQLAFDRVGLDWEKYVYVDPKFYRPSEVENLCGDPSKARSILKWEHKTTFPELVNEMVDAAMKKVGL